MDVNVKLTLLLLDALLTVNSTEGPVNVTVYLNAALLGLFGIVVLAAAKKNLLSVLLSPVRQVIEKMIIANVCLSFAQLSLVHQAIKKMKIVNVCLSSALLLPANKAIERMRIADVFLSVEARLVLLLKLSATTTLVSVLVLTWLCVLRDTLGMLLPAPVCLTAETNSVELLRLSTQPLVNADVPIKLAVPRDTHGTVQLAHVNALKAHSFSALVPSSSTKPSANVPVLMFRSAPILKDGTLRLAPANAPTTVSLL